MLKRMTFLRHRAPTRIAFARPVARAAGTVVAAFALAGCGGSGSPLDNPPVVGNPSGALGQHLSFAYFQKCIQPILVTPLPILLGTSTSINTCAGSGCHDSVTGTGGALRIVPSAQALDVSDPANTPAVIRASDMYKNFYSAQGEVVVGSVTQSRLLAKPLLLNVLHGGGLIFQSDTDPNALLIKYWISHPAPLGQDEFSPTTYSMFTPADPKVGTCNTL
jgi:hypothetical protein